MDSQWTVLLSTQPSGSLIKPQTERGHLKPLLRHIRVDLYTLMG